MMKDQASNINGKGVRSITQVMPVTSLRGQIMHTLAVISTHKDQVKSEVGNSEIPC